MSTNVGRLDANESAFFLRELEFVKSRSYDTRQKQLKATMLIPVSTEADSGAQNITYRSYTGVGIAKIIANYASDSPRADVYGTESTVKIFRIGSSFGYDRDEVRASQMAGKSLDQRRANSAKRASDEKVNSLALVGDTTYGINGLLKYPGINDYTLTTGTGGFLWTQKTADEILFDINTMVSSVVDLTNGVETPDTLLLPIAQYNLISTKRVSSQSDTTVLQYLLKTSPYIKQVEWVAELNEIGASSKDRMLAYVKDADHLTLEIPLPYTQLPPEQEGYGYKVLTETKTAGVIMYYPLSAVFSDGI